MSLDLFNLNTGLSGSVNSIAATPKFLATTALDRFARIHSVEPPSELAGQQQNQKGQVLEKVFTKSVPSSIVWDEYSPTVSGKGDGHDDDNDGDDDDDIWRNMQHVGGESDSEERGSGKNRR